MGKITLPPVHRSALVVLPLALALAAVGILLAVRGGQPSQSQVAACRSAMTRDYVTWQRTGRAWNPPPPCRGLPAATIGQLTRSILDGLPPSYCIVMGKSAPGCAPAGEAP